jgi:hypothetical protein
VSVLKPIGRIIALVAGVFLISSSTNAQTIPRAVLSAPNLEDFPTVTTYLDVKDAQGVFVPGLGSSDLTILEDNVILGGQITEIRPGAQIVVAFNPGSSFGIVDFQGNNRLYYISQAMEYWWYVQFEPELDDLSLVTPGGVLFSHKKVLSEWIEAWNLYEPPLRTSIPRLEVLSAALDLASDPTPRPGMGRVVLFLTPTLSPDWGETIQSMADRATQSNIRVHVVMIDSPALFTSTSAAQLHALAVQTGGQFFPFSNTEPIPDFQQLFESSRRVYQLGYRSQVNTAGEHTFSAVVNSPLGEITSEPISFEVQLQSPNPIFVELPYQIVRAIPDDAEIATENLAPSTYTVEVVVEFPDTIQREIARAALFANGQVVAENTTPPYHLFNWDLTPFGSSAEVILNVEVVDELGMTGHSIDIPVQITIQRPQQGLLPTLARNVPVISLGFVILAGGVLLLVLVLAGRIRPRRIGERRMSRAAYDDPVTQPVKQIEDRPDREKNVLARFRRRLPPTRLRWPQREDVRQEPFAYLTRISKDGTVDPGAVYQVTTSEITFGSDPSEAVVVLEDPAVEPLHSRLWRDDDGDFHVADQESVAGTWLNYAPVTQTGCVVEHGDLIHIAKIGFRFTMAKPKQPRQPMVIQKEEEQ